MTQILYIPYQVFLSLGGKSRVLDFLLGQF